MTWNFHPTHYSAENPTAEIRNEISVSKQQPAPFHISRPKNVTHFGGIKKSPGQRQVSASAEYENFIKCNSAGKQRCQLPFCVCVCVVGSRGQSRRNQIKRKKIFLATESIDPSLLTSDVDEWSSSPVDLDVKQTDQHFFSGGRPMAAIVAEKISWSLTAKCLLSPGHHSIRRNYFIGSRPPNDRYIQQLIACRIKWNITMTSIQPVPGCWDLKRNKWRRPLWTTSADHWTSASRGWVGLKGEPAVKPNEIRATRKVQPERGVVHFKCPTWNKLTNLLIDEITGQILEGFQRQLRSVCRDQIAHQTHLKEECHIVVVLHFFRGKLFHAESQSTDDQTQTKMAADYRNCSAQFYGHQLASWKLHSQHNKWRIQLQNQPTNSKGNGSRSRNGSEPQQPPPTGWLECHGPRGIYHSNSTCG